MRTGLMGLTLLFLLMIIFAHGCGEESPFDEGKPEEGAGSYFPIAVGNVWTHQNKEGEYVVTIITGTRDIDGKTYHVFEESNSEEVASIMFRAASDGIYYTVEDAKSLTQPSFEDIEVIDMQVTVSPPDEWLFLKYPLELGTSWDVFVIEMSAMFVFTTKMTAKVVGSETIRVPAGQFDAVKVDYTTETEIEMNEIGSFSTSVRTSSWFAPDVGIIKTETEIEDPEGGITDVSELVSYEIH